jgi:ATP-dependent RNA helicase SUPV3L1/SUV3
MVLAKGKKQGSIYTVKPDAKRQCGMLYKYYQAQADRTGMENVKKYMDRIVAMDIRFMQNRENGDSFADYLIGSNMNLALNYLPEVYESYLLQFKRQLRSTIIKMQRQEEQQAEALAMDRHYILHVGGTNSGKTYQSIERLKQSKNSVYAGPLRLLALEIYDKLMAANIPCSMVTGEEQYITDESRVIAATVEMVDTDKEYDVAVIDEAQMISDPFRGDNWLRLIVGLKAREIHVCLAPEAEDVIVKILSELSHITYEVVRHERNTELIFEKKPFNMDKDILRGDALILFSKRAVLDVSARLEILGIHASVIYGNLPPQIRKHQFEMFMKGETEVVVATDAIGLGVNLPIRRIIFMTTLKFDGVSRRPLNQYEVRQIAGRAGRRGLYDEGYVTTTSLKEIENLKARYNEYDPLTYARIGFPVNLLEIDAPIDVILKEWYDIPPEFAVYRKMDVSELLNKYKLLKRMLDEEHIEMGKKEIYSLISCEVDSGNNYCIKLWLDYCKTYADTDSLMFPEMDDIDEANDLERAEIYYKLLDLYNHFSVRMNKVMDVERLEQCRLEVEDTILGELNKSKKHYLRRCNYCGKALPIDSKGSLCDKCFIFYRKR